MTSQSPTEIMSTFFQANKIQCGQVAKVNACRRDPRDLLVTLHGEFGTSPVHTIAMAHASHVIEAQRAIQEKKVQYHIADPKQSMGL